LNHHTARRSLAPLIRLALAASVLITIACGTNDNGDATARTAAPPSTRGSLSSQDSARAATVAESTAVARDQWNVPEVVRRLTEAGYSVKDRGKTVQHPGFRNSGELLDVGGSELQVFIYDDAKARARDSDQLDTTATTGAALGVPARPHIIINNNLIALHFTQNGRMAERVHDALMARHRER
jgi:hypothetical protein